MQSDIERVFRAESGRAVASLVRVFGDIDIAEEAVQEAFAIAVQRWPEAGLPPSPAGWIITTARNRAIDRLRRESSRDDRQRQAGLLARTNRRRNVGGRASGRRPPAADLHVLPPGARPGVPSRPDSAVDRRVANTGDRSGTAGVRVDDGPAPGSRQEQDPRRQHPLSGPRRCRAARPSAAGARRRLPHLQRRSRGHAPATC